MQIEAGTPGKLRQAYDRRIEQGEIDADPAQLELITILDSLLVDLGRKRLSRKSSSLGWLFGRNSGTDPVKGAYIWGDVGRGKSMMMDMFYEHLPNQRKRRAHFNDFMTDAQERIHHQRQEFEAGRSRDEDPVPVVGRELAQEAAVLCFDEFTVTDIADAMILGRLFETLFAEGVTIVATSNVEPENLYRNGLNRQIFLRFIDILKENVETFELSARTDYRLEKLDQAPVYHTPLGLQSRQAMDASWKLLTGKESGEPETLSIKGRELAVPLAASGAARLSFDKLCREARSALDYLALARRYHTVFIEDVPQMGREQHNAAKRFILLIDTLYDNHVRVVISAATEPDKLYTATSGTEAFEFKRTASRLHEMQSREYIAGFTGGDEDN